MPKRSLKEIIQEIVLDEMNALGAGGVAFPGVTPLGTKSRIPTEIQRPAGRKRKIAESFEKRKMNIRFILSENLGKSLHEFSPPPKKNREVQVHLDKELNPQVQDALVNFLSFCQKKLDIEDFPQLYLMSKRQPGMTTGAFLPGKRLVFALTQNRLMLDVFRTLSHELTHCKQYDKGELDNLPPRAGEDDMSDIDTPYENEAYMNAGNFVKMWSRLYKKIPREDLYVTVM
jgi:hypothetical protein